MNKVYAYIKFRNGKKVKKEVNKKAIWIIPLISIIITTILFLIILIILKI
jgi:paraquat-inducible protein B